MKKQIVKKLSLPKANIIVLCVMAAFLLALAIVLLVLPDDVYIAIGDPNPDVGRYVWFVLFGFCALVVTIRTITFVTKQKKLIADCNALSEAAGENAFFAAGYCAAINKNDSDARKTAVSVLGATASAVIFGAGAYRVYSTDTIRLFLFCDDGLYIIRSKTREKCFIKNGSIKNARIDENYKEQLVMTCPCENFVLTFDTHKIDVTNQELAQKLTLLAQHCKLASQEE